MSPVYFEISNVRRHDGTTLVAFFDVTLPGVIIRDCRFHVGKRGAFIAGPTMKSKFAVGGWAKHAEFDDDLSTEILEAVSARLEAENGAEHAA